MSQRRPLKRVAALSRCGADPAACSVDDDRLIFQFHDLIS
jgi:hypothetical protein